MKRYIFGLLVLCLCLGSCAGPRKIARQVDIKGFTGLETNGYSEATLSFDVDNGSRKDIHLNDGYLIIKDGSKTLAKIKAQDVTIRKRTSEIVDIPLKISLNQMQLLASMSKLAQKPGELTVTGEITIKSGIFSKKFNFADKPITEFLKDIGLDDNAIEKMLE